MFETLSLERVVISTQICFYQCESKMVTLIASIQTRPS